MSLALIRAAGRRLAATAAAQSPSASSFSSSAAGGAAASTTLPDGEEILPPPRPDSLPPASADARDFFRFEIVYESKVSRARVGRLHTPNGVVDTPAFVAVGTNAALKAVDQRQADATGLQLMFCNTYHLLLQPGPELVASAGGLHRFMNRRGPIMTDSGGFQVFSLAHGSIHREITSGGAAPRPPAAEAAQEASLKRSGGKSRFNSEGHVLKISEAGVLFKSYRDGSRVLLTPESSVAAQKELGADVIIPLDELPPFHISERELLDSLRRSHRWMTRSLAAHLRDVRKQAMYAVVHGGTDLRFREASARFLRELPFDGFAVGGSLGKTREDLFRVLGHTMPLLPRGSPTHLLGIGDPLTIEGAVPFGVDSLDSSFPTKLARHGTLLVRGGAGRVNVKRAEYRSQFRPPEEGCGCSTCREHSMAYLHHLHRANEPLLGQLASVHNLHRVNALMGELRQGILDGKV